MSDDDLSEFSVEDEESTGNALTATDIAEYIRFNCCPRFFKLKVDGKTIEKSRRWPEAFKPISPLLYGVGKALEEKKVAELKEKAAQYCDFDDPGLRVKKKLGSTFFKGNERIAAGY